MNKTHHYTWLKNARICQNVTFHLLSPGLDVKKALKKNTIKHEEKKMKTEAKQNLAQYKTRHLTKQITRQSTNHNWLQN